MFDFLNFKNQLAQIKDQVSGLEERVKNKRDELHRLRTSPPQKSDVIAHFDMLIDRLAGKYDKALKFSVDLISGSPLNLDSVSSLGVLTAVPQNVAATVHSVEAALLALFHDDIKTSLRKRIEAMPWAKDAGPRIAERPALIEKAERELAKLETELAETRSEAAAAGITI